MGRVSAEKQRLCVPHQWTSTLIHTGPNSSFPQTIIFKSNGYKIKLFFLSMTIRTNWLFLLSEFDPFGSKSFGKSRAMGLFIEIFNSHLCREPRCAMIVLMLHGCKTQKHEEILSFLLLESRRMIFFLFWATCIGTNERQCLNLVSSSQNTFMYFLHLIQNNFTRNHKCQLHSDRWKGRVSVRRPCIRSPTSGRPQPVLEPRSPAWRVLLHYPAISLKSYCNCVP